MTVEQRMREEMRDYRIRGIRLAWLMLTVPPDVLHPEWGEMTVRNALNEIGLVDDGTIDRWCFAAKVFPTRKINELKSWQQASLARQLRRDWKGQ